MNIKTRLFLLKFVLHIRIQAIKASPIALPCVMMSYTTFYMKVLDFHQKTLPTDGYSPKDSISQSVGIGAFPLA